MDLSALIFVALAVAWAVYLIPKALRHHDEDARSRTVDAFSHTMRVLARREPINRRSARLVVTPGRPASTVREAAAEVGTPEVDPAVLTPALAHARRRAAARAAKRRLRVLCVILAALLIVVVLAASSVIGWVWVAIPAGVMVAWLVACRLMVREERAVRRPRAAAPTSPVTSSSAPTPLVGGAAANLATDLDTDAEPDAAGEAEPTSGPITEEIARVAAPTASAATADPALWDPVPVTLPTYVTKPAAARRTVRTIDLDDTGVWTSGRTQADSQIARDADEAERAGKAATSARDGDNGRRASGS